MPWNRVYYSTCLIGHTRLVGLDRKVRINMAVGWCIFPADDNQITTEILQKNEGMAHGTASTTTDAGGDAYRHSAGTLHKLEPYGGEVTRKHAWAHIDTLPCLL